MFTHLQVHTHYSLLEAIGSPKAYIEQAKQLGMEALACTDYSGMYGAIEFYQAAKKAGIQPLLGVELGYVPDITRLEPTDQTGTILLLARSYTGYQHLLQLVSIAHLQGFHGIPRIDPTHLQTYHEDIITISGGTRSRIGKLVQAGTDRKLIADQRKQLETIIGSARCFLSRIAQEKPLGKLGEINDALLTYAQKNSISCVISGDVHYIHEQDQAIFETALSIKDGKRIYDTDRRLAPHQLHLRSEEEIISTLQEAHISSELQAQLLEATHHVTTLIDIDIPMGKILFPNYESSDEIKQHYNAASGQLISS